MAEDSRAKAASSVHPSHPSATDSEPLQSSVNNDTSSTTTTNNIAPSAAPPPTSSGALPSSVLYTWGRAKNFRLGRRHVNADSRTPERVDGTSLAGHGVLAAACGGGHTCVLLDDHTLRVFGYSQYGQLGVGDRVDLCEPTMPVLRAITAFTAPKSDQNALRKPEVETEGERGTTGIGEETAGEGEQSDQNAAGDDNGAEQGVGEKNNLDDESNCVVDVSCGRYHTIALTSGGHVYSWGGGKNGRLGHGDEKIHTTPQRIESLVQEHVRITAIACGYHSNLALSNHSELYSWGWGAHGQLGHGNTTDCMVPRRIEALRGLTVAAIACGDRHSFAITDEGQLFGWGSNEYNQLGTGKRGEVLASPALIKGLMGLPVKQMSSGDRHTAAVTTLGAVYMWGCGSDGQIGQGDYRDALRPRLVARLAARVDRVQCGHNFTLALTDTHELFAWGANVYGQLGNGGSAKSCVPVPVTLPSGAALKGVSCAHFHCVLWTSASHESGTQSALGSRGFSASALSALSRVASDKNSASSTRHGSSSAVNTRVVASSADSEPCNGSGGEEATKLDASSSRGAAARGRAASGPGGAMLEALKKLELSYFSTLELCNAELLRLNQARDDLIKCIDDRALNS